MVAVCANENLYTVWFHRGSPDHLVIFHFFLLRIIIFIYNEFNSFMADVPIIKKPVHWFEEQISGLVSIW